MSDGLQPDPILQSDLPDAPWLIGSNRLPGTGPVAMADVLRVDDAYAGQMALRERLMDRVPALVHALAPDGRPRRAKRWRRCWVCLAPARISRLRVDRVIRPDGVDRCPRPRPPAADPRAACSERLLPDAETGRRTRADRGDPVLSGKLDAGRKDQPPAEPDPRSDRRTMTTTSPAGCSACLTAIRPGQAALARELPALRRSRVVPAAQRARPAPTSRRRRGLCPVRTAVPGAAAEDDAVLFSIHTTVVRRAGLDPANRRRWPRTCGACRTRAR